MIPRRACAAVLLLISWTIVGQARQMSAPAPATGTVSWSRQGADAGMTKYSSSDLPARVPTLAYRKRFFDAWAATTGNYFYGQNVVIRSGRAVVFASDVRDGTLKATVFDWRTGETLARFPQPYKLSENQFEVDLPHFSNPLIWHDNGQIYSKRGGDNYAQYRLDPATGVWTQVGIHPPPDSVASSGDQIALIQTYGNQLIHRYGHVNDRASYSANDILTGAYQQMLGPFVRGDRWRYGDWPKVAKSISVLAAYVDESRVLLDAVNALTGLRQWQRVFPSDAGGVRGTTAGVSDYWRFLATEDGWYVFFTRSGTPEVHVLDLLSGTERINVVLGDPDERPLLAAHGGFLYVIGRAQQAKINLTTGAPVWQMTNRFPNDAGYVHRNFEGTSQGSTDPMYRPIVLTDSTLWFVDGQAADSGNLIGLNTATGRVVASIDIAAAVRGGSESLELVNDLAEADGKLGVLVTIRDSSDPHPPQMPYQDLLVYDFGAGPSS
jgi:PQQ-like domain